MRLCLEVFICRLRYVFGSILAAPDPVAPNLLHQGRHGQCINAVHSWSCLRLCCKHFLSRSFPQEYQIKSDFSLPRRSRKRACGQVLYCPDVEGRHGFLCFTMRGYPINKLYGHWTFQTAGRWVVPIFIVKLLLPGWDQVAFLVTLNLRLSLRFVRDYGARDSLKCLVELNHLP